MSGIADVRVALADAVATIDGVRCSAYSTDTINAPQGMIVRKETTYDLTFGRGADTYAFSVLVFVQRDAELSAQQLLDTMVEPAGATSVKAAIEGDMTLGGLVQYARVRGASDMSVADVAGVQYLITEFEIEVVV